MKIFVAVADVDALVTKGSAIDSHAWTNTTSVYTSARVFAMLPERLSTDLTSLNPDQDRLAIVTEMVVAPDGSITQATLYRAKVRNHAKLAYDALSAWIDGDGPLPDAARAVAGLDVQLRTQDAVAQQLRVRRHAQGSLELETFQPRAVFDGERVVDIRQQVQNRARQLIEEFMIATNECSAPLPGAPPAALRCAGWCARPSAGCASSRWPASTARACRKRPTRWRSPPSWPSATGPTRCAFPISRW